jgi:hypothetical protein
MMRSSVNELRKWISCGLVLGFLAAAQVLPAAEVEFLAEGWSPTSASQSSATNQEASQPSQRSSAVQHARSSVSLAPAIVMVRCKFSQSYTLMLTLVNQTQQELVFEMVAEDVVVRDGKRAFVPAGETPGSLAATAIFSQKRGAVEPGQSASVGVTFTVPPETPLRAAVALFRGENKVASGNSVTMMASLGTLFTFTVSENFQMEGSPVAVTPQSATTNLGISQVLTNTGTEPVVAGGVAAVLNETGMLVGKASFEEQRLLPGERLPFRAEYPAELKSGHYRVFASFQYEEKVITNSGDFTVR